MILWSLLTALPQSGKRVIHGKGRRVPRSEIHRQVWVLCTALAATLPAPEPLAAQAAYTAANSQTSIVPLGHGFLAGDFAEAKFALTFVVRKELSCDGDGCTPNQLNLLGGVSAAARKGQRDIFSNLNFNPGFDVGGRLVYVAQREGPGYGAVYVGVRYSSQERHIIDINTVTDINTLDQTLQRTFAASVGFNYAFSEVTIVGIGFEGRWERSSPGIQLDTEFCTPGTSANGLRVLVCRDRFVAPLLDLWGGHARIDLNIKLADLGSAVHAARLGLITAASVDVFQGANETVNFGLGPSVHIRGYPGHTAAALLFGLRDVFDANQLFANSPEQNSYFSDHFLVRLVFGIPFPVLVGN